MPVITVGLFLKPAVLYKKLKKNVVDLGFELGSQTTELRHLTAAIV